MYDRHFPFFTEPSFPLFYHDRKVTEDLGDIPKVFHGILERVAPFFPIEEPPDSLIVNEYEIGQGIMPHVDSPEFGPVVVSVSLLSACALSVQPVQKKGEMEREGGCFLKLPPRSAVVLAKESRYGYTHGISKEKVDWINGEAIERSRRISLTIRRIQGYGWKE